MRYTHPYHVIRKRKHVIPISIFLFTLSILLVLWLGFSQINAHQFILGFIGSIYRVTISFIIAFFIASLIGLLLIQNNKIEDFFLPILDALQSFPSFSILPLLIVFLGRNDSVIITILSIEMIWPILFSFISATKNSNPEIMEAAVIFNAKGLKKIIFVTLPLTFPFLVTGSIVAWGIAWETVLASEIVVSLTGVGTFLSSAEQNHQDNVIIIGIILLLVILFIINKLFWVPLLNKSSKYQ